MSSREIRSIKDLMPHLLSKLAINSGSAFSLGPIWQEAVGPAIAKHATPVGLENRTLLIQASSRGWQQALEAQTPELLDRLNGQSDTLQLTALKILAPPQ